MFIVIQKTLQKYDKSKYFVREYLQRNHHNNIRDIHFVLGADKKNTVMSICTTFNQGQIFDYRFRQPEMGHQTENN